MTTRASVTSLEFYRVTITPTPDDDPTGLPVRFAFPDSGTAPVTWYAAQWESGGPPYVARLTIGPGGDAELEAGAYDAYVEITDTPEVVRFLADRLVVFEEVTTFASVSELADVLHADIDPEDPQAVQALTDATAYIRAKTGQTISLVEGDEQELVGTWARRFWLPQRPVLEVSELSVRYRSTVTPIPIASPGFTVTRLGRVTGYIDWGGPDATILVTYDHGYAVIPEDIRMACLHLAGQNYSALVTSLTGATAQSVTIGSYSRSTSYGALNASDPLVDATLPPSVQAVLDRYTLDLY